MTQEGPLSMFLQMQMEVVPGNGLASRACSVAGI